MLTLYFAPGSSSMAPHIALHETGAPFEAKPLSFAKKDTRTPEFLAISPNNKMPAIVDGDSGLAIFESGAILQYLAEKTGKLLPSDTAGKYRVLQWVFWQVGGLGPMAGQAHHFLKYSPQKIEYAMHRFQQEVARLYKVLDTQLGKTEFIAGEYSIADIAAWPWVVRYEWQGQKLEDFPNVKRWFEGVGARPAVMRGAAVGADLVAAAPPPTDEDRKRLFGLRDKDLKPAG